MAFNNSNSNSTGSFSSGNDGRIRSLPHNKNGPYICSKCSYEFATSQKFAAHVSSAHYKYETKAEKKQRMISKVRGKAKDLQLVKLKNGLITAVPRDYAGEFVSAYVAATPRPPAMVKVESVELADGVRLSKYALAPPPGMPLKPDAGVKIKVERPDEY